MSELIAQIDAARIMQQDSQVKAYILGDLRPEAFVTEHLSEAN